MDDPELSYRVGNGNPSVPPRMHEGAKSPSADSRENVPNVRRSGDSALMPEVRSPADIDTTLSTTSISCNVQCGQGGSVASVVSASPNASNYRARTDECDSNNRCASGVCSDRHGRDDRSETCDATRASAAPVTYDRPLLEIVTGSQGASEGLHKTHSAGNEYSEHVRPAERDPEFTKRDPERDYVRSDARDDDNNKRTDSKYDQVAVENARANIQSVPDRYKKRSENNTKQLSAPHAYLSAQPWERARPVSVHGTLDYHQNCGSAEPNESSAAGPRHEPLPQNSSALRPKRESEAFKFITLCDPVHSRPFSPPRRSGHYSSLSSLHAAKVDPGPRNEGVEPPDEADGRRGETPACGRMSGTAASGKTPLRYKSPFVQRRSIYAPNTQFTSRIRPGVSYASHESVPNGMNRVASLSSLVFPSPENSSSNSSAGLRLDHGNAGRTRPLSYAGTAAASDINDDRSLQSKVEESQRTSSISGKVCSPPLVQSPPRTPKISESGMTSSQMDPLPPKVSSLREDLFPSDQRHSPVSLTASSSQQNKSTGFESSERPLPPLPASLPPVVTASAPVMVETHELIINAEEKYAPMNPTKAQNISSFDAMAQGYIAPGESASPNANDAADSCSMGAATPKPVTTREDVATIVRMEAPMHTSAVSTATDGILSSSAAATTPYRSKTMTHLTDLRAPLGETKMLPRTGTESMEEKEPKGSLATATGSGSNSDFLVSDMNKTLPNKFSQPVSVNKSLDKDSRGSLVGGPERVRAFEKGVQHQVDRIAADDAIVTQQRSVNPSLPVMDKHSFLPYTKPGTSELNYSRTQEILGPSTHLRNTAFTSDYSDHASSNSKLEFSNARPKNSPLNRFSHYNNEGANVSSFSHSPPSYIDTQMRPNLPPQSAFSSTYYKNDLGRRNSTHDLAEFSDDSSSSLSPTYKSMAKSVSNLKQMFDCPKPNEPSPLLSARKRFSSLQKLNRSTEESRLFAAKPDEQHRFTGNRTASHVSSSSPSETDDSDQAVSSSIDIGKLIRVYDKDFKPTQKPASIRPNFLTAKKHQPSTSTHRFVLKPQQERKQLASRVNGPVSPSNYNKPASVIKSQQSTGEIKSVPGESPMRNQKYSQRAVLRKNLESEEKMINQQSNLILEELRRQHQREKELIQQRKLLELEFEQKRHEIGAENIIRTPVKVKDEERKAMLQRPLEMKKRLYLPKDPWTECDEQQDARFDDQRWRNHELLQDAREGQRRREYSDQLRRENQLHRKWEDEKLDERDAHEHIERKEEQRKKLAQMSEHREHVREDLGERLRREREEQWRKERMEQLQKELQELQQREIEEKLQREREEQLKKEIEEQLLRVREQQLQREREQQLQREREQQLQREREQQLQREREQQLQREREQQLQMEREQQLQREREQQLKKEIEEQLRRKLEEELRKEFEEKLQKEREEHLKKELEEHLQKEREEHLQRELEEQLKIKREDQLKREREEQLRKELMEQLQRERKKQLQNELQEQLLRKREEQLLQEREEQLRNKRDEQQKEQEEQLRKKQEEQLRKEQEERLRKDQEEQLRKEQEEQLRKKQEEQLRKKQEEQLRKKQEEQLRKKQEEQLRKEQEEQLWKEQEEQLRKEQEEQLRKEQEEQLRKEQEEQLRKEQEEQLRKEQEEQLRKEQEEQLRKEQEEQLLKEREIAGNQSLDDNKPLNGSSYLTSSTPIIQQKIGDPQGDQKISKSSNGSSERVSEEERLQQRRNLELELINFVQEKQERQRKEQLKEEYENLLKMEQEEKERFAAVQKKIEDEREKLKRKLNLEKKVEMSDSVASNHEEQHSNCRPSMKEFTKKYSGKEKSEEEGNDNSTINQGDKADSAQQDVTISDTPQIEVMWSDETNDKQGATENKSMKVLVVDPALSVISDAEADQNELECKDDMAASDIGENTESSFPLVQPHSQASPTASGSQEEESTVPASPSSPPPLPTVPPPPLSPQSPPPFLSSLPSSVNCSTPTIVVSFVDASTPVERQTSEPSANFEEKYFEPIVTKEPDVEEEKIEIECEEGIQSDDNSRPSQPYSEPIDDKSNGDSKLNGSSIPECESASEVSLEEQRKTEVGQEEHAFVSETEKGSTATEFTYSKPEEHEKSTVPDSTVSQVSERDLVTKQEQAEKNDSPEHNINSSAENHEATTGGVDPAAETSTCQLVQFDDVNDSNVDVPSTSAINIAQVPSDVCNLTLKLLSYAEEGTGDETKCITPENELQKSSIELANYSSVELEKQNEALSNGKEYQNDQESPEVRCEPISSDDTTIDSGTVPPEITSESCAAKGVDETAVFEAESLVTSDTESVRAYETESVPFSETESMKAVHSDNPCSSHADAKEELAVETIKVIPEAIMANETDYRMTVLKNELDSHSVDGNVTENDIIETDKEDSIIESTKSEGDKDEMVTRFDEFFTLGETQIVSEGIPRLATFEDETVVETQQIVNFDTIVAEENEGQLDEQIQNKAESHENEKSDGRESPFEDFTLEAISDEESTHLDSDNYQMVAREKSVQETLFESPVSAEHPSSTVPQRELLEPITNEVTRDPTLTATHDDEMTPIPDYSDPSLKSGSTASSSVDQVALTDGVKSCVEKTSGEEIPLPIVVNEINDHISMSYDKRDIISQDNEICITSVDVTNHFSLGYVSTGSEMEERLSVSPTEERTGVNYCGEKSLSEVTKVSFGSVGTGTTEYVTPTDSLKSLPVNESPLMLDEQTSSIADITISSTQASGSCTDNLESTFEALDPVVCSDSDTNLVSRPDLAEAGAMSSVAFNRNSQGAEADKVSAPLLVLPPGDELEADCAQTHEGESSDLNGSSSRSEIAGSELNVEDTYTLLPTHNTTQSRATPPKSPTTVHEWVASLPCPTEAQVLRSQSLDSETPENHDTVTDDTLNLGDEEQMQ